MKAVAKVRQQLKAQVEALALDQSEAKAESLKEVAEAEVDLGGPNKGGLELVLPNEPFGASDPDPRAAAV